MQHLLSSRSVVQTEQEREASGLCKGTRIPLDSSDRQTDSGLKTLLNFSASHKLPETSAAALEAAISCTDLGQTESLTHTATLYAVLTISHALSAHVPRAVWPFPALILVDGVVRTVEQGALWRKYFPVNASHMFGLLPVIWLNFSIERWPDWNPGRLGLSCAPSPQEGQADPGLN